MKLKPSSKNLDSHQRTGILQISTYNLILCATLLGLGFFAGCAKPEPPPRTITEAQKVFEQKCLKEYELSVITKRMGTTFWVYLPTKSPIFDYEAQKENNNEPNDNKRNKFSIQYLDSAYKDKTFYLEYDIVNRLKSSKEDYGYSSTYTESYLKLQNNIFIAISDSFFGAEPTKTETAPQFVVVTITDIKKGIESRVTFYLEDFKRYMTGDLPNDEYMKRFLADTKGGQNMIGDEIGSHVQYKEITMPDFLAKQIANRITFKFQHSDFPPSPDFDKTIASLVADTVRFYHFEDYSNLKLDNLRANKKYDYGKEYVKTLRDDVTPDEKDASKGKLIHIVFENGKSHIQEDSQPSSGTLKDSTTTNKTQ